MEAPFTITISITDAAGKKVQLFENYELGYEPLVAVQEAIAAAFVGLGKAGIEAHKKGNAK